MKKLIICEKPSLAMNVVKSIGNMQKKDGYFENDEYIVTFAFGHLLELKDIDDYLGRIKTKWSLDELPFIPSNFEFKLKDDSGVKKQFKIISSLLNRKDIVEIINCGDADREGEVIINNIVYKIFSDSNVNKPLKRLWLPEQTEDTIRKQLKDCQDIKKYENLYNEGLARTYIDWLYGINLTRYLTLKVNNLFPVGRVLVPIVRYIYDRDMEISNFVPKNYFEIETIINKDDKDIKLSFKEFKFDNDSKESEQIAKNLIQKLINKEVIVEKIETSNKEKQRPKLFSLDSLQNYCFKKYKLSLAETLKNVQSLYEQGFVTYPRTNTEYLSNNEKDKVKGILTVLKDEKLTFFDKKTIFDDSKIESHSAIIVTTKIPTSFKTSNEELVYNTILNRFKSVFCKEDTILEENKIYFKFDEYHTKLIGKSIKQKGYLEFEPIEEDVLPKFIEGEKLLPNLKLTTKTTQPPKKVTEAELNNFLKNPLRKSKEMPDKEEFSQNSDESNDEDLYKDILDGLEIGTVATRSGIIENTIKYGYVKKEKNSLLITDKGITLIENLEKLKIDFSVNKTVQVSKNLKDVYKGSSTIKSVINLVEQELKNYINKNIEIQEFHQQQDIIGSCPKCHKNILENDKSFYCEDYKNCNFSIWKKNKFFESLGLKHFSRSNMKDCLNKGYFIAKGLKSKNGKLYDAKLVMKVTDKYVNWEMEFNN